ncbi:hypothetical protein IAI10_06595 [Clostridium sp. 19966]|uniref:hypothetical protein n=1 Tax=Clostridium sp. 19966 TaxID=2768166 RepID=UPI0028DF7602|nr:hypothetical protein [Clostridium sp. 19966]MDT8716320.1 hypothetical protein [Clostridium sp. 19966]
MALNKAAIPVYLNTGILNNLFTVVVQEFIEIKSFSTKDAISMHFKTPVSELSYDIFGKYMQGDFDIQIQNEFVKQRTEETISTTIVILKKLQDILAQQQMLKNFTGTNQFEGIDENDYVDFSCNMSRNPIMDNMRKFIQTFELANIYTPQQMNTSAANKENENAADTTALTNLISPLSNIKSENMLSFLKSTLNNHVEQRCLRYLATSIENTNFNAIIPMKYQSFLDNEDYILNGKVRILGKVVKKYDAPTEDGMMRGGENDSIENHLFNDEIFDYFDYDQLQQIYCPFLRRKPEMKNFDLKSNNIPINYEILPIAIYI